MAGFPQPQASSFPHGVESAQRRHADTASFHGLLVVPRVLLATGILASRLRWTLHPAYSE